jgi:Protein of unknown function (DUF2764)
MSKYYIYGALPPLEFGVKPEISSRELGELFLLNLSSTEAKNVQVLKLWIDISNIYSLLNKGAFDVRGNYSKSTIKSLIANSEELPSYVLDFFQEYESEEDRKKYFPRLMARYFSEEKGVNCNSTREFLDFEHDMRVLFAGFRAKNGEADLAFELQFEDMSDPIVLFVLMQAGKGGGFQFPAEYEVLEKILDDAKGSPSKIYESLAAYRFQFYIKYYTNFLFSLDGILAYMCALWILEDFFALKQEIGESFLSKIVERGNVS